MDAVLAIHVAGGAVAIIAGTLALSLRKGSPNHKKAGYTFVIAMLTMALPGGVLAALNDKPFDVLSSLVTGYWVVTGWLAFKTLSRATWVALMGSGFICLIGYLAVELYALSTGIRATDAPSGAGYVFALVIVLSLRGDYHTSKQPDLRKRAVVRHLWRMTAGLFVATMSFFGARPHLFPEVVQSSGLLLLLAFAPLLCMIYFRWRQRDRAPGAPI